MKKLFAAILTLAAIAALYFVSNPSQAQNYGKFSGLTEVTLLSNNCSGSYGQTNNQRLDIPQTGNFILCSKGKMVAAGTSNIVFCFSWMADESTAATNTGVWYWTNTVTGTTPFCNVESIPCYGYPYLRLNWFTNGDIVAMTNFHLYYGFKK